MLITREDRMLIKI